jgi:hypothetical protein
MSLSPQIEAICAHIAAVADPRIILLRNPQVIQWLFGDTSFLPAGDHKTKAAKTTAYKQLEDVWGQAALKARRPDLRLDGQWTNKFGEHICEELFILRGKPPIKPSVREHYQPDLEVDDAVLEAKAQTYFTSGTAGEKILGCPFKYAEVPALYGKPLQIVCMGGAERASREQYGNLAGPKCSPQKQKMLDCFAAASITFIGATDLLMGLLLLPGSPADL